MENDRDGVLGVNRRFYDALAARDLTLMATLWVPDERAKCIHPGWTALVGWEAIRQSWENVFDPRDQAEINLSEVNVEIRDGMAWVTCVQEMVYVSRVPVGMNISVSTNVFIKEGGRWLMTVHHASPIPLSHYDVEKDEIQ